MHVDTLQRDITDTTVQAIIRWLSWVTEQELHQAVGQQLEHPNEQYHLHLESTHKALTQPNTPEESTVSLRRASSLQIAHATTNAWPS